MTAEAVAEAYAAGEADVSAETGGLVTSEAAAGDLAMSGAGTAERSARRGGAKTTGPANRPSRGPAARTRPAAPGRTPGEGAADAPVKPGGPADTAVATVGSAAFTDIAMPVEAPPDRAARAGTTTVPAPEADATPGREASAGVTATPGHEVSAGAAGAPGREAGAGVTAAPGRAAEVAGTASPEWAAGTTVAGEPISFLPPGQQPMPPAGAPFGMPGGAWQGGATTEQIPAVPLAGPPMPGIPVTGPPALGLPIMGPPMLGPDMTTPDMTTPDMTTPDMTAPDMTAPPPAGRVEAEPGSRRMLRKRRQAAVLVFLLLAVVVLVIGQVIRDNGESKTRTSDTVGIGTAEPGALPVPADPALPTATAAPTRTSAGGIPADAVDQPPAKAPAEMSAAGFTYVGGYGPVLGTTGTLRRFKVTVEKRIGQGSGVDFADEVDRILGDPRSWIAGRQFRLQRVPQAAGSEFTIYLTSAETAAKMCATGGLKTGGFSSCRMPGQVVMNLDRWQDAVKDYGAPLEVYRAYTINHEVGHQLGHNHEACPGKGEAAPVMMQQTYGLKGCVANAWPYLSGRRYAGNPIE